jgi:hypothetical protein
MTVRNVLLYLGPASLGLDRLALRRELALSALASRPWFEPTSCTEASSLGELRSLLATVPDQQVVCWRSSDVADPDELLALGASSIVEAMRVRSVRTIAQAARLRAVRRTQARSSARAWPSRPDRAQQRELLVHEYARLPEHPAVDHAQPLHVDESIDVRTAALRGAGSALYWVGLPTPIVGGSLLAEPSAGLSAAGVAQGTAEDRAGARVLELMVPDASTGELDPPMVRRSIQVRSLDAAQWELGWALALRAEGVDAFDRAFRQRAVVALDLHAEAGGGSVLGSDQYAFERWEHGFPGWSQDLDPSRIVSRPSHMFCAACGRWCWSSVRRTPTMVRDHDPVTRLVRGLLCLGCSAAQRCAGPRDRFWRRWRSGSNQYASFGIEEPYAWKSHDPFRRSPGVVMARAARSRLAAQPAH